MDRTLQLVMAASIPDDDHFGDAHPMERASRYWKNAAEMYSEACEAQNDEVKTLYIQVAMCWATMAHELEKPAPQPARDGQAESLRH